ncbi:MULTISPECIES: TlpA family protein disulfide reductase [unclassified Pseudomonas]|uniref:TlpA family protein disulfide reductase n=1 Tax=unclassified Pseudomonas TaxID=196821 RepID=UPI0025FB5307|nr:MULTISPECIES: TlpA disulfide reductase family protein [unclassified Pseudomonas]
MLSFSVGPFALAISHALLFAALLFATLIGWLTGRRQRINPERALFGLFLLGLLVSRLAFAIAYREQYQTNPTSIIDIRDGGFLAWPGVVAVVLGAALCAWKRPTLRAPLGVGVVGGLLFWWLAGLAVSARHNDAHLPELTLLDAAGQAVPLENFRGKRLVVNLWATWCPPCRREMPMLQAAQQANSDVVFMFVNQAESPREVATFLARQGLHLNNVLFDSNGEFARQVGSSALPTTLFYDSDGRLSASHLGGLSAASLKRYLDDPGLDRVSPSATPPPSSPSFTRNTQ